jgi:hypothetical protein
MSGFGGCERGGYFANLGFKVFKSSSQRSGFLVLRRLYVYARVFVATFNAVLASWVLTVALTINLHSLTNEMPLIFASDKLGKIVGCDFEFFLPVRKMEKICQIHSGLLGHWILVWEA